MSAYVVLSETVAAREFDAEYPNGASPATCAALRDDAVMASLIFE